MVSNTIFKSLVVTALFLAASLLPVTLQAQQYGPRSFAIAPDGLNVVTAIWEHQNSSFNSTGTILFKDANVKIDALTMSYNHYFDLFGKTAQVSFAVPYVFIDAETGTPFTRPPLRGLTLEADPKGFADPYTHFAIALYGGDSVSAGAFAEHEAGFSLHGLVALRAPLGTYSNDVVMNTGQNRWEFRVGLPMIQQWGKPGGQTTLEFTSFVHFFTNNDDLLGADSMEQDPLVHLEAHVTRDIFSGLFTVGLDVNYIFGGETSIDGISSDNNQEYWTTGLNVGGRFSRSIGWTAIFAHAASATEALDGAHWFRIILNYSF